jgi:CHAT domain-containing protein
LYRRLIAPVQEELRGRNEVVVSADGALHYLPFAVLLAPNGRRLIEEAAVRYVPSGGALLALDDRPRAVPTRSLLAYGDPLYRARPALPATRREVSGVSAMYGEKEAVVRLGPDANMRRGRASPGLC